MRFQSIPRAARKFAEDNLLPARRAARKFAEDNLLPARRAWRKFAKDNPMKAGGLAGLAGLAGLVGTTKAIKEVMRRKVSFGFVVQHYSSEEELRENIKRSVEFADLRVSSQREVCRFEIARWVRRAVWASWTQWEALTLASQLEVATPKQAAVALEDRFDEMQKAFEMWSQIKKIFDPSMDAKKEFEKETAGVEIDFKELKYYMVPGAQLLLKQNDRNASKEPPSPPPSAEQFVLKPFLSEVVVKVHSNKSAAILRRLWYATVFHELIVNLHPNDIKDKKKESQAKTTMIRTPIKKELLSALKEIHASRNVLIRSDVSKTDSYHWEVMRQRDKIISFLGSSFSGKRLFVQLMKECLEALVVAWERLEQHFANPGQHHEDPEYAKDILGFIQLRKKSSVFIIESGPLPPVLEEGEGEGVNEDELMKQWETEKREAEVIAKAFEKPREKGKFPIWIKVENALHYVFPLDDGFNKNTLRERFCGWFHNAKAAAQASIPETANFSLVQGGLAEAGEAACENISVQLLFFQEASRSKMEKDLLPPGASKICVSMTEAELGEAGAKLHTKILQTDAREIFAADASPM